MVHDETYHRADNEASSIVDGGRHLLEMLMAIVHFHEGSVNCTVYTSFRVELHLAVVRLFCQEGMSTLS